MVGDTGGGIESPVRPAEPSSRLTFNWWGLVAVLLLATITLVAWRWLEGASDDDSNQLGGGAATAPTNPVVDTASTTTTSTTTLPAPNVVLPSTTVTPDRQVLISGEMRPCRFGANCLVASFAIVGFDEHPGRFVCIYPNSRREFPFNNDRVDDACLTADAGDTISIEVDGVRSAAISEQNLDGT